MTRSLASIVLLTTMLGLGVAQAHNTPQEESNKKLVRDFYNALDDAQIEGTIREKIAGIIEKYIAVDYIQHQEGGKQGRAGMLETVAAQGRQPAAPPAGAPGAVGAPRAGAPPGARPERGKLVAIMAEGDRVIQVTSRERRDPATGTTKPSYIWNMFRIDKGMLAEHWDSPMPGPAAAPDRGTPR
jgi:predicted SnoaL-like aldol condensation-catalyzing enzyme